MEHYHIRRRSGSYLTRMDQRDAIETARAFGTQMHLCRGGSACPEALTSATETEHASGLHYQAFRPYCSRCQGQSPNVI